MNCTRANCGHDQATHSDLMGCLAAKGTGYCDCPKFSAPPVTVVKAREAAAKAMEATAGRALADEGAARAYAAEADAWREDAAQALDRLIDGGAPFTAEDLRREVGRDPVHANAMGAVFRTAARQGRIRVASTSEASRTSAHGRLLRVWVAA